MHQARWAKFSQRVVARYAVLSTRGRPLEHRVHRDRKAIPGVIIAGIRMKIRDRLSVEPRATVAAGLEPE